jgi:hypothetical protein
MTEARVACLEGLDCEEASREGSFDELCPVESGSTPPEPAKPSTKCGDETCGEGEYCSLAYDTKTSDWIPAGCSALPAACEGSTLGDLCGCLADASCESQQGQVVQEKCSTGTSGTSFGCRYIPL